MKVEFFIPGALAVNTGAMMYGLIEAAKEARDQVMVTNRYHGGSELLVIYGVGAPDRAGIRKRHVDTGRPVIVWDLGYFGPNGDRSGYLRCSIDHDHPQAFLDGTEPDPSRWDQHGIPLREDYNREGHIVLVGLGRKSRSYLNEYDWETKKYYEIVSKYPGQKIVYRPKPGHPAPPLNIETNINSPIHVLLKGAALVVCRHSNVAVDATIAGVPFECEDGAAIWLRDKPFTRKNRLDFLNRLAWWQWRAREAEQAWKFVKGKLPLRATV